MGLQFPWLHATGLHEVEHSSTVGPKELLASATLFRARPSTATCIVDLTRNSGCCLALLYHSPL